MIFVLRSSVISGFVFFSALIGLIAQKLLPAGMIADAKTMISSVVGLDATLLALVLGLLIWTSHGLFTGQQAHLQSIVKAAVLLDLAFIGYGPETAASRKELREHLKRARTRFWIGHPKERRVLVYGELTGEVVPMRIAMETLVPTNEEQRQYLAMARTYFSEIVDTQVTMVRGLINTVPTLLLNVVVVWSCLLFFGYGLLSGFNALVVVMAALGAFLVGSAAFLILELSDPYVGWLRLSTAMFEGLQQSLARFEAQTETMRPRAP